MISETQMRYGSRVSRHAIGRAAFRNHRRSSAEIHTAERGSSLVSSFIGAEPALVQVLPRGGEPPLFPLRDPARNHGHVPEPQFPHHLGGSFGSMSGTALEEVGPAPIV